MIVTQTNPPTSIEEHLVQRAARGDRAAFGELYSRYARVVHAILLGRVRFHEAEDLVQDVFVTAMSRLSQLRDSTSFSSWICTIARNRAYDFHRSRHDSQGVDEIREEHLQSRPAPPEAISAMEAIRSLPESYRETLLLRLVEGMTGPEIAFRTGLTHESVRVNLCRGMKMLREKIEGKQV